MAGRIANGWELARQSWSVLLADKKLLVLPLISSIACMAVLASFAIPLALNIDWHALANSKGQQVNVQFNNPTYYALLFTFYFANYFVVIFFNAALVACVREQFRGGTPTVSFGLSAAASRLPQILLWALLSATVGMILQMIAERSKLVGQIIVSLLGAAWSIATYFAVPVLVVEQAGPFDVFKRSAALLKKSWGEGIVANVSMGLITGLLFLLGLLPLIGAIIGMSSNSVPIPLGIALIFISVIYCTALALVTSTLKVILTTALYEYASSGTAPGPFQGELLQQAFRPKK
jgi:hypothetical protein